MNRRRAARAAHTLLNLSRTKVPPSVWTRSIRVAREAIRRGASQKLAELTPLVALVAHRRPASVVEIGSGVGGTLWAWSQVADDRAAIVSIDLLDGPFSALRSAPNGWEPFARATQQLSVVLGDSHTEGTRARAERAAGGAVDFLFIDGDHSYDGVRSDFEMYRPLVRRGGMIGFHDILPAPTVPPEFAGDVHLFWPEVKRDFRTLELLDVVDDRGWGGRWGGIGVLFV